MSNQINLQTKTTTELKALAYDIAGFVQQYQQMLQTVNQEIANRIAQEQAQKQPELQESKPVLKKVETEPVAEAQEG